MPFLRLLRWQIMKDSTLIKNTNAQEFNLPNQIAQLVSNLDNCRIENLS
jgi:hypothetical protein